VIIDNLHICRTGDRPAEAYAILIVNPDTVLARAIALQRFKTVSGRHPKVAQSTGNLQLSKLAPRNVLNALEPPDVPSCRQRFRIGIAVGYDHRLILTQRMINVKRDYRRATGYSA
jgi:hypothetical protein